MTADWKSDKNFRKFYCRNSDSNVSFSNAVFHASSNYIKNFGSQHIVLLALKMLFVHAKAEGFMKNNVPPSKL